MQKDAHSPLNSPQSGASLSREDDDYNRFTVVDVLPTISRRGSLITDPILLPIDLSHTQLTHTAAAAEERPDGRLAQREEVEEGSPTPSPARVLAKNADTHPIAPTLASMAHPASASESDGDDGDGPSAERRESQKSKLRDGALSVDEMQEARLRVYDATCPVSTLDFLKETTETILPDAFNAFFSGTSTFIKDKAEIMAQAMPPSVQRAVQITGKGLSIMAEYTGDVLVNAPNYVMEIIPDHMLSREMKKLIFVDFLNVLKCSLNFDILFVPYIFRTAGLVGALILLAVVDLVCLYTSEVFYEAKNQLQEASQVVMYADVTRLTWGTCFPLLDMCYSVLFFMAFVRYAATNAFYLLTVMHAKEKVAVVLSYVLPPLCCLLFVFMKRAKSLEPLVALSSVLVLVTVIVMMTVFPYSSFEYKTLSLWPSSASEAFTALGIILFVSSPLRRSVPVERTMDPRRFRVLMRVATGVTFLCNVAFGLSAFLSYDIRTCSVLPLSFQRGGTEIAAAALLFFIFLFVVPQSLFRITEFCDCRVLGLRSIPTYWQIQPNLMRIAFLVAASLLAYVLPYFGVFLAVGGAFGCGLLSLVFPAALDYVRRERLGLRQGRRLRWWEYILCFTMGIVGGGIMLAGVVFGCYEMWTIVEIGSRTTC